MSKFYEPVFSDVVKDVIGNDPVLDQFDIAYAASFYGTGTDDYITGTMLIDVTDSSKDSRGKRFKKFKEGNRPRGRTASKYYAGSTPSPTSVYGTNEVRYNPLQSFREVPWTARVSRTAYRISQCYDSKERYYDSCLPDVFKCFLTNGSEPWTISKKLKYFSTNNPNETYPLWSAAANYQTNSLGFMYFNAGNLDRPEDGFYLDQDTGTTFSDNDWTWSYPFESKYDPTSRQTQNKNSLGLDKARYVTEFDGYKILNITQSILRPKKISGFVPILPGKLPSKYVEGFNGRNTFRSGYFISSSFGSKLQYPVSPQDPKLDEVFGQSYLIPSDVDLSNGDNRASFLEPWIGVGFTTWKKPGAYESLTGSMTFDDTVKFLFGFGDLNNMTYAQRLFEPVDTVKPHSGTLGDQGTNPADGQSITIVGRVYTFRNTLTTADEVKIGSTSTESLDNLIACINGTSGSGYAWHATTMPNTSYTAKRGPDSSYDGPTLYNRTMVIEERPRQGTGLAGSKLNKMLGPLLSSTGWTWYESYVEGAVGNHFQEFKILTGNFNFATHGPHIIDDYQGLRVEVLGQVSGYPSWRLMTGSAPINDPNKLLMTGSRAGVRQFFHYSGSTVVGSDLTSLTRGLFGESFVSTIWAAKDQPALTNQRNVCFVSDTITTHSGNISTNGGSAVFYINVTSSYPWSIAYDSGVAANTRSSLKTTVYSQGKGVDASLGFAVLEEQFGTATLGAGVNAVGLIEQFDVRANGLSGSMTTGIGQYGYSPNTSAYKYPFDPGVYQIEFSFNIVTNAGTNTTNPCLAAVKNLRIIQYREESFPPNTGSTIGGNNYPVFRRLIRDQRVDEVILPSTCTPPSFPLWYKPSYEFVSESTSNTYTSQVASLKYDDTDNLTNNGLIHSGTIFGVAPVIRGWKYGLFNGLPTNSKAVFRRDKYGQLRDMLEQRHYTKFVNSTIDVFDDNPLDNKITSQDSSTLGKLAASKQRTSDVLGPSVVEVNFVRQRYTRDDRGIGTIYNEKVSPDITTSQNLSTEVTSSLPYFDGVARHRSEDDLGKTAEKKITSLTLVDGNLTVT
jgi:hypothetical protein